MATHCVTFPAAAGERFIEDVKTRVGAYFATGGLSQKANAEMVTKTVVLLSAFVLPYLAIMTLPLHPLVMWGLCAVMGLAMAGIGFAVSHDALHGAYSANPRVNAMLGFTFDMLGANGYMWQVTHNVIHHTYTNIQGIDEDLEVSPLLRLSPRSAYQKLHRYQHLYALGAYSMSTLNWVFWKDFDYFTRRRLGPYDGKRHTLGQWAVMLGGKVFYYGWAIALPLAVLPLAWWQVAIGFLTVHVIGGVILGVVFQLAHVVEETAQPAADAAGRMPDTWMIHEMLTTANFCNANRWLSAYVGGLNFQIEHHLFPKTCSAHYPAISVIVRQIAKENGVPYYENPTLWSAVRSHWKMLYRLGRKAESLPPALAAAA